MPESKSGALPLGDSPRETAASTASSERPQRVTSQRPRNEAFHVVWHTQQRPSRGILGFEGGEDASPRTRHACTRLRSLACKRVKMTRNLREPRSRSGVKIVAAIPFGKDHYFRGPAIACQFRRGENARCRHACRWCQDREPRRRKRDGQKLLANTLRKRRLSENKKWNVGAQLERDFHQCGARHAETPQPIEPQQNRR